MQNLETIKKSQRKWGIAAMVCGGVIAVSMISGLLGTIIGMISAFNVLEKSGEADPVELGNAISFAMLTTLWGCVFAGLALIVLVIAVVMLMVKGRRLKQLSRGAAEMQKGG